MPASLFTPLPFCGSHLFDALLNAIAELDFDAAAGQNLVLSSCRDKTRRIFDEASPQRRPRPPGIPRPDRRERRPGTAAVTRSAAGPPGDKRECSPPMGTSQYAPVGTVYGFWSLRE